MLSEAEIRKQFARGYGFPPVEVRLGGRDALLDQEEDLDALLVASVGGKTYEFVAEFKSRNTPRIFEGAVAQIERAAKRRKVLPMLVMPYLRESQLSELQERGLSGLDLSGNGVINVPGELLVYRTGLPNLFPDSSPTKYAYRGATSLAARAFLCQEKFASLAEIRTCIEGRGGEIALSTISKALARMESDLIVDRTPEGIRLRQGDKLLEQLVKSQVVPKITKSSTLAIKMNFPNSEGEGLTAKSKLQGLCAEGTGEFKMVLSGRSSLEKYAVMGRQEWPVMYTKDIDGLLSRWGERVEETSRFVDFELRETEDPTVYFDARENEGLPYASPIQAFVECAAGDKREQEAARQVKDFILSELKPSGMGIRR